ncbi:divergent polysaccharide deacetylase family protein [Thioalkalivibrio thiocyanodenitrificans]|uniref:divergent polysaccharide deacetylase family protein n=1 Tax=Thioalkalivibrio thiocyanodenitrificans TaxID=243063 RepID=UPI0003789F47|nr:divergent polysaccharide deacetylase family protein [Thioalkalivibrio thiocyanodenitrificans]
MRAAGRRLAVLWLAALAFWAVQGHGGEPRPFVAIIIDDLGNQHEAGLRTLALPGALTLSFLPHTPHAEVLAIRGHEAGKEIMLHLPMQAGDDRPLGPGGITADMDRETLGDTLRTALASVPHARGVNNHMGSLLTRQQEHMDWFMAELASHDGLYFVDSRTTALTVAQRTALSHRLPATRRHVFLDWIPDDESIVEAEMDRLLALARQQGHALAIGHPHGSTLAVLERRLAQMHETGVELVTVSDYLQRKKMEANRLWHASSSLSPTAPKNSKPSR